MLPGRWPAFALAVTSPAAAQERFGNITGKVTDQTGAVLPGVTVTVTNNETQRSTVVVSDANGTFYATALDPGRYAVKFELSGFVSQEAPNVILLLGTTATVDSSLRVGGVTETVQVLAGTPRALSLPDARRACARHAGRRVSSVTEATMQVIADERIHRSIATTGENRVE